MRSYEVHRFRCQPSSYGPPGGGAGDTVLGLATPSAAFDVLFAAGECGPRRVFSDMGVRGTVSGSATRFAAFGVFLAAGECGPRCVFSDMSHSQKLQQFYNIRSNAARLIEGQQLGCFGFGALSLPRCYWSPAGWSSRDRRLNGVLLPQGRNLE